MFTIHFHKPPQWHWMPSTHQVVQFLPNSKYCHGCCVYQWLFIGIELRLKVFEQSRLEW